MFIGIFNLKVFFFYNHNYMRFLGEKIRVIYLPGYNSIYNKLFLHRQFLRKYFTVRIKSNNNIDSNKPIFVGLDITSYFLFFLLYSINKCI